MSSFLTDFVLKFDFDDEIFNLFRNDPDKPHFAYWAYDGEIEDDYNHDGPKYGTEFTSLRQTIVLLCAAMNEEL